MKKRTHLKLTKCLLSSIDNDLNSVERLLVCFGSVFPDITPLCVIKPHKLGVTNLKSFKRLTNLSQGGNKYIECFRLGCLSHHLADYFTAPHNRTGLKGFCLDHRSYENNLDDFFDDNLFNCHLSEGSYPSDYIDLWRQMFRLHKEYKRYNESMATDFNYIVTIVAWLFGSYLLEDSFKIYNMI